MKLWIGTAGYSYPDWVGSFYPAGTTAHDQLPFYARRFPMVEINSTFYRPPTIEQVAKMARRTPPGFGFTLKVPQSASHQREAAELPTLRVAADYLAAAGKLLGLLFQVPEAFHDTPANRDWLRTVGDALRPHPVAVEFRHSSWSRPGLEEWIAAIGLELVSVGVPRIPSLFPPGVRVTNRRVYARLHSQNADNWYAGGKDRYDYDYPEPVLRKWAGALQELAAAGRAEAGLFVFNNCVGAQAAENARKFAAVVREVAPAIGVIDPPAVIDPQPALFEA